MTTFPPAPAPAATTRRPPACCRLHCRETPRVLVVDDCRDTAWSFQTLLELWGFEAEAAHDGESAIAAALARVPDVVLLDLAMPIMDGCEVARRLRRQRPTDRACLIAVSGFTDGRHRELAAAAGFHLFLAKPVDPVALQSLLVELVTP